MPSRRASVVRPPQDHSGDPPGVLVMFSPFIDHVTCSGRVRLIPRVCRGVAGEKGGIANDNRVMNAWTRCMFA